MAGRSYGEPGASLSNARAQFGDKAVSAGISGEAYFRSFLKSSGALDSYDSWFSLGIPRDPKNPNGPVYRSDVDCALASGKRLLLVDVKRWSAGYHYWTLFGLPFKNLAPILKKDRNGQTHWKLSRNMDAARSRYKKNLPGVQVDSVVVFVPSGRNGSLPASVRFMKWPGGIRSIPISSFLSYASSFLGPGEDPEPRISSLLTRMQR